MPSLFMSSLLVPSLLVPSLLVPAALALLWLNNENFAQSLVVIYQGI
jgi:hypothetical protein